MIEAILGIIGVLGAAVAGLFWRLRKTQQSVGEERNRRQAAEEQLEHVKTRQQIDQDIKRNSGNNARDELRRDWTRK